MRSLRAVLSGIVAFACLSVILFGLLRWRMNTSEQHLNLGHIVDDLSPGQSHE